MWSRSRTVTRGARRPRSAAIRPRSRRGCSDEHDDAGISGNPVVGNTLTCSSDDAADWTGSPTLEYQWVSTSDDGLTQDDITGETAATYDAAVGELGLKVACLVTATNDGGAASAQTGWLGPVAAVLVTAAEFVGYIPI